MIAAPATDGLRLLATVVTVAVPFTVCVPVAVDPVKFTLPFQTAETVLVPSPSENGCEVALADPVTKLTLICGCPFWVATV